ncbi:hypothetical protein [Pseudoalteromonas luteoviolacea]|uniref:hypothetical protein n=1 Tax=Pseudoalteromonas luteoviolacea TaxID=43657 RepID=UPI000B251260|nr:hypothetical protein [Pseudoalteromonas luteoviolacea]MBE0388819.1 hypothetical protein [Pseudoalteromonas luteoviolacea DSM 6061]
MNVYIQMQARYHGLTIDRFHSVSLINTNRNSRCLAVFRAVLVFSAKFYRDVGHEYQL